LLWFFLDKNFPLFHSLFLGRTEEFFHVFLPFRGSWEGVSICSSPLGEGGRGFKIAFKNIFNAPFQSPLTPPKGGEILFFFLPPFKEGWGGFYDFIFSSLLREAGRDFESLF